MSDGVALVVLMPDTPCCLMRYAAKHGSVSAAPAPPPPLQGIEVKMITGDHLLIGKETAKMLGMGTQVRAQGPHA